MNKNTAFILVLIICLISGNSIRRFITMEFTVATTQSKDGIEKRKLPLKESIFFLMESHERECIIMTL